MHQASGDDDRAGCVLDGDLRVKGIAADELAGQSFLRRKVAGAIRQHQIEVKANELDVRAVRTRLIDADLWG